MRHRIAVVVFSVLAVGTSSISLDAVEEALAAGENQVCVRKCASFKAGASAAHSKLVCQYQASGVGSIEENAEEGVSCFPAYNCREDWDVCVPQELVTGGNTVGDVLGPLANVSNTAAVRAACNEITTLEKGGYSASEPPSGGWIPTSLGWYKGTGNVGCGWGSTYGHTGIDDETSQTLAELGRVELSGYTGPDAERDCCVAAMQYETTSMDEGGAAVRFDVTAGGVCRIDRAMMMRGNLDASSGKSMDRLVACGDADSAYYWRHAAGAGDAANLKQGGRCVAANNFTRVVPVYEGSSHDASRPLGQLPGFEAELPNHPSQSTVKSVVYNTISTAEECCEACSLLLWIGNSSSSNPCVAFQIVDGRCRILRLEWFSVHFGAPGNGDTPAGDHAMGVTEVVAHCAGFANFAACDRADNSHGNWESCAGAACDYFSHMYYRDPGCLGCTYVPPYSQGGNATYTSIQPVTPEGDGAAVNVTTGINATFNVTVVRDRWADKILDLLGLDFDNASRLAAVGSWEAAGLVCARIAVYSASAVQTDAGGSSVLNLDDADFFADSALATSEVVCVQGAGDALSETLGQLSVVMDETTHPEVFGTERRRSQSPGVVVSFECIGPGLDLCDFHSGSLAVAQTEVVNTGGPDSEGLPQTTPTLPSAANNLRCASQWLLLCMVAAVLASWELP